MCCTCQHLDPKVCPSCNKANFYSGSYYQARKEVLWISLSGLITLSLFCGFHLLKDSFYYWDTHFLINLLLSFLIGISIYGVHSLMKETTVFDEIKAVPFIGWKLSMIALVLTVLAGIPVIYFLIKSYRVFKAQLGQKQAIKKNKFI